MKHRITGFTFLEMLIAIAIIAILASLAVPSFRTMLVKRSVQSAAVALVSDLRFARSEAVRRSVGVSVCSLAINSANTCSGSPANWANGWMVFVDPADTGTRGTRDLTEEIIRVQQPLENMSTIQSPNRFIPYEANGWSRQANGTFVLTPVGAQLPNPTRIVCVSLQGRVRLLVEGAIACS